MNRVLVIIVSYNAIPWVDRCLGSLRKSKTKVDVFIVDNGSTDGTQAYIKTHYPEFMFRQSESNIGFGAANNIAVKYAVEKGYDYVYLLNQDAWIKSDTINKMIEAWPKGFGILSPMQRNAKGRLDANFDRKCSPYINGLNEVETVPFVMAAHWLVSRETLKKVGGFSPAFNQYGEDDNYIDRLHYHGLKVGIVCDAEGIHDRDSRKMSREQRMKLKCVSTVVRMSDPNACWLWRCVREPLELAGMSLKNFSLIPIKFIPEIWGRREELKILRRMSKKSGAFLISD